VQSQCVVRSAAAGEHEADRQSTEKASHLGPTAEPRSGVPTPTNP
jgi:hypothetical protein